MSIKKKIKTFFMNEDNNFFSKTINNPDFELKKKLIQYNYKNISELTRANDNPEIIRYIQHIVYFKNETEQNKFIEEVIIKNFTVINKIEFFDTEFSHCIELLRADKTDRICIENFSFYLFDLAQKYDGRYSGWATVPLNYF